MYLVSSPDCTQIQGQYRHGPGVHGMDVVVDGLCRSLQAQSQEISQVFWPGGGHIVGFACRFVECSVSVLLSFPFSMVGKSTWGAPAKTTRLHARRQSTDSVASFASFSTV